jgi:hypothetical protein
MCLPGVRSEYSIRCLEVLGLGPEPDPLQMSFFFIFMIVAPGQTSSRPQKLFRHPRVSLAEFSHV